MGSHGRGLQQGSMKGVNGKGFRVVDWSRDMAGVVGEVVYDGLSNSEI